jgi:hypothetical protein
MSHVIVVQNHNRIVSGFEKGLITYAYEPAGRVPKLFETPEEAAAWWSEHAPTLPPVGKGGIRVEPWSPPAAQATAG